MIYTRFFSPVNVVEVRRVMRSLPRGEFEDFDVRLAYARDLEDGSAKAGDLVCEGEFVPIAELKADDGIREIHAEVLRVEKIS